MLAALMAVFAAMGGAAQARKRGDLGGWKEIGRLAELGVMFRDMKELQSAPGCHRNPQRVGKSRTAQIGKIGRMQNGADGRAH